MKAAMTDGRGVVNVVEVPMPVIGDYDCLVKIRTCAFCNTTDRHIVDQTFPFGLHYPCLLGHESIGQIVEVGGRVKNFSPGDWVSRAYALYPGETTADGAIGSGWGGFSEYGKIVDGAAMGVDAPPFWRYMQKLPSELSPDKAVLLSCFKEVWSSLEQIDIPSGADVFVAGAGIVGRLFARFLKLRGNCRVTLGARRAEQLSEPMADHTVLFMEMGNQHYDIIVETTGSLEVAKNLTAHLRTGGHFYSYAIYPEMGKAEFEACFRNIDYHRADPDEAAAHAAVCGMLIRGELDSESYITHRIPLAQFDMAWETVVKRHTLKTVVELHSLF